MAALLALVLLLAAVAVQPAAAHQHHGEGALAARLRAAERHSSARKTLFFGGGGDSKSSKESESVAALKAMFPNEDAAFSKPVVVAIRTHHFFGSYARSVPDCVVRGRPIKCEFVERTHGGAADADALWYHVPSACGTQVKRDAPHQLAVAMSMEASTYYGCLDDVNFMDQFDVEMTYRLCSHLPIPYAPHMDALKGKFFRLPLAWEKMENAIAYINSNCGALNGRNDIVNQLMRLNQLPVHAWGACLRNKVAPHHNFEKMEVFRQYKFCISMENSNTQDYVTEKIWHAFESGCLPIYQGAPNINDYAPAPNSYIDYTKFGSPGKLMDYLVKLSQDRDAYMAMHAWRTWPVEKLSPGFRKLLAMVTAAPHSQCGLCQIVMENRLEPKDLRQTHCFRNETWLALRKTGKGSSWGPGSDDLLQRPLSFLKSELKPSRRQE